MTQFDSQILFIKPYRYSKPVRFGDQANPVTLSDDMLKSADQFRQAIKDTERMSGCDAVNNSPFEQLIAQLLNGNTDLGRKLIQSINKVMVVNRTNRSCQSETYTNDDFKQRVGYRVKCGIFDKLFQKRTLCSEDSMSFESFLENRFGKNQRVIISFTGWTKPPVDSLLEHTVYKQAIRKLPKEQWPKFAENVYVNIIKQFIDDVIKGIKEELPGFNPITDLGVIYGVTQEGVDRGVQEYCQAKSIPLVGLTCYDWVEYVPDEAGLPDVYIANEPAAFGTFMADSSNKIVITGGRSYAASFKLNGQKAKGADRRIPVDLFKSYADVSIPPVASGEDEMTAKVVNAAALAKLLDGDPWNLPVVQKAINGRKIDNSDAFATIHILKKELEKLYQMSDIALNM